MRNYSKDKSSYREFMNNKIEYLFKPSENYFSLNSLSPNQLCLFYSGA